MSTDSTTGTVTVADVAVPALGFGTAGMTGETCRRAVEAAFAAGYRHVDTAQMYDNEAAVGDAIDESPVARDEVFVVTKVHPDNLAAEDVTESTRESLDRLGLQSVDLLLIHGPRSYAPIEETIGAMNELQAEGLVDHVGVSNFSVAQLETAIDASETPIVTNQVKYHPYNRQDDLLAFCFDHDVLLTAYSPLARGAVAGDERLAEIGDRYGKTPAQVTLRWLLQQPMVAAIPKAASREHVEENLDVFDFELTDEEMRTIFELDGGPLETLARRLGL